MNKISESGIRHAKNPIALLTKINKLPINIFNPYMYFFYITKLPAIIGHVQKNLLTISSPCGYRGCLCCFFLRYTNTGKHFGYSFRKHLPI